MALITDAKGRPVGDDGGRVYRIEGAGRKMIAIQAVVQPILMAGLAAYLVVRRGTQMLPFAVLLPIASLFSSAFLVGTILKSATVLYPDRIEARGLFQTRSVLKSDISSFRYGKTPKGARFVQVMLKEPGRPPVQFSCYGGLPDFSLWFQGIPEVS